MNRGIAREDAGLFKRFWSLFSALAILLGTLNVAQAASLSEGGDGFAATHHRPVNRAATTGPTGLTPTQLKHAYGVDAVTATGSGQIVAIVDAFDDPSIAADLGTFNSTYGLPLMNGTPGQPTCTVSAGPHPCFQKVFSTTRPRLDTGWAVEISIDVMWSHAIAPSADILLVESVNNGNAALYGAVDKATNMGAHAVSMSWGGGETATERNNDKHFNHTGVTYLASSGDGDHAVEYPAASPDVVAVGGTSLQVDSAGNVLSETVWNTAPGEGSSGGISAYESEPSYQTSLPIPSTSNKRGVPDVSYDADPATGVSIYCSTSCGSSNGWSQWGGTSIGAPQWAALIAIVDQARGTLPSLSSNNLASSPEYNAAASSVYAQNYRDITVGNNGTCGAVCNATPGYDFTTGVGSPLANNLVPFLTTH
jgi:subtilase family serine protease